MFQFYRFRFRLFLNFVFIVLRRMVGLAWREELAEYDLGFLMNSYASHRC